MATSRAESETACRLDVLCVQRCCFADLGCNQWLLELLLPFSGQPAHSDLWPLTSTRHFAAHKCCSLDIFSFWDHSLTTLEMDVCKNLAR